MCPYLPRKCIAIVEAITEDITSVSARQAGLGAPLQVGSRGGTWCALGNYLMVVLLLSIIYLWTLGEDIARDSGESGYSTWETDFWPRHDDNTCEPILGTSGSLGLRLKQDYFGMQDQWDLTSRARLGTLNHSLYGWFVPVTVDCRF